MGIFSWDESAGTCIVSLFLSLYSLHPPGLVQVGANSDTLIYEKTLFMLPWYSAEVSSGQFFHMARAHSKWL